ncbi:MAG: hypothetical protein EAZ78_04270 [Oscillatoriales cyanobacterium]|uniref:Transposase n=1 Tax=Microcoleus anatoxicus PTRS2 TaxID=2705321 RepID=A0ABU8YTH4_9CYAN|nr:MAG: hypothetical protein EA000_06900 [Oscillatoriales cyanobacterium]TAD97261.1 MAG: hypothetical protein EAZ98_10340 [Oscillatoriales cyanobacterium]TAE05413.1 MAG: hypothetical protein EAZ96_05820 [Oscillatoriales cyanobacterium]TAF05850.1 MAG: hypothetical protein EAZ78_04270 [Oscillatoriales cyanobacterium]TAF71585.1 MAG: hypothetical protein EAZ59_00435 [Oscillatoriales cyanobacterium]
MFCQIPKAFGGAHLPDVWGLALLLKKVKIIKSLRKEGWGSKKKRNIQPDRQLAVAKRSI